jgi:hypothetical protein
MKSMKETACSPKTATRIRLFIVGAFALAITSLIHIDRNVTPITSAKSYAAVKAHTIEHACDGEQEPGEGHLHSYALAVSPAQAKNSSSDEKTRDAARKRTAEMKRDWLKAEIKQLDESIRGVQTEIRYYPDMAWIYSGTLALFRDYKDLYAGELNKIEDTLKNWDTWGRKQTFAWEVDQSDSSSSTKQSSSRRSEYFRNEIGGMTERKKVCYQCGGGGMLSRMCGRCTGSGSIQRTVGPGLTSCYNCGGTGRVRYSCNVCSGAGYTWTN